MSAAARPVPWARLSGPPPRRPRLGHPWLGFAAAACAAVLVTLAVPLAPPLQFAYPAPSLHVALETGTAVIGLLATAIVVRGWRDGQRLDRLIMASGLALIALTSAVLAAMVAIEPGAGPRGNVGLTGMLVGSLLVAAGAFAPARLLVTPGRAAAGMVLVAAAGLLLAAMPIELVLDNWRGQAGPAEGTDLARALLSQPLAAVVLQLTLALILAVAAIGLAARGVRADELFARRLGLAVLFFAFSMLHYALLPPPSHGWVHLGDVLRLLFCIVLLWAAVLEVASSLAARAAARERRRIARDLHDGVAQELAFIRRRAARMAGQAGAEDIVVAADRALLDSRWAIEHLARAPDEPLGRVLGRHAAVIAARTGVAVTFSCSGSASVGPDVGEALARILGEAVANARHGNATLVHVELSTDPLRLRVVDDGHGFDVTADATGFGLGGMRERAELLGAELSVRSGPGAGTEVAVELR